MPSNRTKSNWVDKMKNKTFLLNVSSKIIPHKRQVKSRNAAFRIKLNCVLIKFRNVNVAYQVI